MMRALDTILPLQSATKKQQDTYLPVRLQPAVDVDLDARSLQGKSNCFLVSIIWRCDPEVFITDGTTDSCDINRNSQGLVLGGCMQAEWCSRQRISVTLRWVCFTLL